MVSAQRVAFGVAVSVLTLMIPYFVAVFIDFLFARIGFDSTLAAAVTPIYVLALKLLFVGLAFAAEGIDIVGNMLINVINFIAKTPLLQPIDISGRVVQFGDQIDSTVLDFVGAFGVAGSVAIKKAE